MEQPKAAPDNTHHAVFGLAMLAALGVLAGGVVLFAARGDHFLLSDGIFAVLLVAVTWPIAAGIAGWKRSAEAERAAAFRVVDGQLQHIAGLLTTMGQQTLLSDRAKGIAYRSKDRQALRDAIREEMNAKDWDSALVLANDMEREFGYVQEAAALRAEINRNRTEVVQAQVAAAIAVVDQQVVAEQWTQAVREAERVMSLYPNDPQVQQLPALIESRRQHHKKTLRDAMEAAANRQDYDAALEMLRRLDPYLTPAEATGMQEMVRGLLKDRLNSYKEQITKAHREHNDAEAVRLCEIVMAEHPNSRLAIEAHDIVDALRKSAASQLQPQPA